jgi:hypothetical protein
MVPFPQRITDPSSLCSGFFLKSTGIRSEARVHSFLCAYYLGLEPYHLKHRLEILGEVDGTLGTEAVDKCHRPPSSSFGLTIREKLGVLADRLQMVEDSVQAQRAVLGQDDRTRDTAGLAPARFNRTLVWHALNQVCESIAGDFYRLEPAEVVIKVGVGEEELVHEGVHADIGPGSVFLDRFKSELVDPEGTRRRLPTSGHFHFSERRSS